MAFLAASIPTFACIDNRSGCSLSTLGFILFISKDPSLSIKYLDFILDAFSINSADENSIASTDPSSIDSLLLLLKFSTYWLYELTSSLLETLASGCQIPVPAINILCIII